MKRFLLFAVVVSASVAGCATPPPNTAAHPSTSQDANGAPTEQTYRTPRASIGVGIGNWGGRGFGGVGIGLGF